jgi:hypothetical protein
MQKQLVFWMIVSELTDLPDGTRHFPENRFQQAGLDLPADLSIMLHYHRLLSSLI